MENPLNSFRRKAKQLSRSYAAGDSAALRRIELHPPRSNTAELKHADFLHVIAQENNFASWPQLKMSIELDGLDRARILHRLKIAIFHGQKRVVESLLADTPDLADGTLGLEIALYRRKPVFDALATNPDVAVALLGPRRPILHLAFSKYIHARPELADDMIAIAEMLVEHGADVNDGMPSSEGSDHKLSALYGALGHANNIRLAEWLLNHGADPNDGESLYHSTELGHREGLRLLLDHGAKAAGTNALPRALDFNDHEAVQMLLDAGADPNEWNGEEVGGEKPWVIPALHQAARRMCDAKMAQLLIAAGSDTSRIYEGVTPYAMARVFGNAAVAKVIEQAGGSTKLSAEESLLARAAEGEMPNGQITESSLPTAYSDLLRSIIHLPGDRVAHARGLIHLGLDFDKPDGQGLTPGQIAGWEGLPDILAFFLSLGPDLDHVNNYGGTYLSTVIHGSENAPDRATRDHVSCARLLLEAGVPLSRQEIEFAGDEALSEFLHNWAEEHPDQIIEHDQQ